MFDGVAEQLEKNAVINFEISADQVFYFLLNAIVYVLTLIIKNALNFDSFRCKLDLKRLQKHFQVSGETPSSKLRCLELQLIAVEFEVEDLRKRH